MSLKEAILDVASRMETECDGISDPKLTSVLIRSWARELKTACVAAGDSSQQRSMSPEAQHATMIEQARKEFRDAKRKQESSKPRMIEAVGGDSEGYIAMEDAIPVGAHTQIGGQVYTLRHDGKLHYDPEQTQRLKGN